MYLKLYLSMWESVKHVLIVPKYGVPSNIPGSGMLFVPYGLCIIRCGHKYDAMHGLGDIITGEQPGY